MCSITEAENEFKKKQEELGKALGTFSVSLSLSLSLFLSLLLSPSFNSGNKGERMNIIWFDLEFCFIFRTLALWREVESWNHTLSQKWNQNQRASKSWVWFKSVEFWSWRPQGLSSETQESGVELTVESEGCTPGFQGSRNLSGAPTCSKFRVHDRVTSRARAQTERTSSL